MSDGPPRWMVGRDGSFSFQPGRRCGFVHSSLRRSVTPHLSQRLSADQSINELVDEFTDE